MLDKDKLILVCYFACGDMSRYKAMVALADVKQMLINTFDDSVKVIVIPQLHSHETKLEFINANNEILGEIASQELQANINKFADFE